MSDPKPSTRQLGLRCRCGSPPERGTWHGTARDKREPPCPRCCKLSQCDSVACVQSPIPKLLHPESYIPIYPYIPLYTLTCPAIPRYIPIYRYIPLPLYTLTCLDIPRYTPTYPYIPLHAPICRQHTPT